MAERQVRIFDLPAVRKARKPPRRVSTKWVGRPSAMGMGQGFFCQA